jgi:hypothetical protein
MKTYLIVCIILLFIFSPGHLLAQGETALPFLNFNPSPRLTGMGLLGTAYPNEDPAGFYYNPAQLGHTSQTNNISLQVYPSGVDWGVPAFLRNIGLGYKYKNLSFNVGYNFSKLLGGLNLSAGFGYIHSKFDFGNFNVTGPDSPTPLYTIDQYDRFDAYGFGVGIDYFVQFSAGITYKNIHSQMPGYTFAGVTTFEANISAIDYGLLLTVPLTKLVDPQLQFSLLRNIPASPYLNLSLGYANLNVGNEIYYIDPAQADPLPRTARLGYTISAGLNIELNNSTLKALSYDFTVDDDASLVQRDTASSKPSYKDFFGNIKIGRNLIGLKSDNYVVVHKGHNINLLETISFQIGRFDGRGYYNERTSGFGIQTKGIFTLLKSFSKNDIVNFIADHLDVQYYSTKLFADSAGETKFEGINLIWYGMML